MIVEPIQSNFSAGEISPRLRAQTNTEIVGQGLERLENMHPENHGPAYGRDGMRKSGITADRLGDELFQARLFTFDVARDDSYTVIIEPVTDIEVGGDIGDTRIRVIDRENLQAGTYETFEIRYNIIDSTTTADHSKCAYARNELEDIHYVQIKDQMIFVHGSHPPMKLVRYKKSNGDIRWSFTYLGTWGAEWGDGYQEAANTITQNGVEVTVGYPRCIAYYQQRIVYGGMTNNPNRLVFTRTDDFTVIDNGFLQTKNVPFDTFKSHFGDTSKASVRVMKIMGNVLDSSLLTVTVDGKTLTEGASADYTVHRFADDFTTWPSYMQTNESLVQYQEFQQSLLSPVQVGRAAETYIYFTSNQNFNTSDCEIVVSRPEDSAVIFDIASTTQDFIQWLAVGEGLFIGTTGGEWVAAADVYISAINPPSIGQVSFYGSRHIQPISVGDAMLYVTASGRELRAFRSDYTANREKWDSLEMSWAAEHMFRDYPIKELAYTQTPDNVIWVMTQDGSLYSMVYDPNIKPSAGWARHPINAEVRNITSASDALYDQLVMAVKRTTFVGPGTNSVTALEYQNRDTEMDNMRFWESGTDLTSVDLTGSDILFNLITQFGTSADDQVNICIKSDGAVDFFGTYDELVASGRLTGSTYTLVTPGRFVEAGVPFRQHMKLADTDFNVSGSDYGKKRKQTKILVDLINSQVPTINGDYPEGRTPSSLMGNLEPPIDGKVKGYGKRGYDRERNIEITQEYPFRLQVAAVFERTNMGTES